MERNTRQDWWFLYVYEGHLWFGVSASWPIKGIQDSPWILDSRCWISVILSVWILIVGWIPDSLSCIPDFKAQDSKFHKHKLPRFRNPDSLWYGVGAASYPDVSPSLSLDENFPWSLAVHHQSLAFRARLYHAKNEAPEEEAGVGSSFWSDKTSVQLSAVPESWLCPT